MFDEISYLREAAIRNWKPNSDARLSEELPGSFEGAEGMILAVPRG
jgi:hypothetical protein